MEKNIENNIILRISAGCILPPEDISKTMKKADAILYSDKDHSGKSSLKIGIFFYNTEVVVKKNPILVKINETNKTIIWQCVLAVSKMVHVSKESITAVVAAIVNDPEYNFVEALALHPCLEGEYGKDYLTADRLRRDILAQNPLPVEMDKIESALW